MRATALLFLAIVALAPAAAQSPAPTAPDQRDGRYSMTPTAEGFLRLDTRTGGVSLCRATPSGAECRAGADERDALQAEIDRLSKENEDLRRKMASGAPGERLRNALPTDEEMNKALTWMEQLMRRMMRVFRDDPPADRI
jgi:hypothetical protein